MAKAKQKQKKPAQPAKRSTKKAAAKKAGAKKVAAKKAASKRAASKKAASKKAASKKAGPKKAPKRAGSGSARSGKPRRTATMAKSKSKSTNRSRSARATGESRPKLRPIGEPTTGPGMVPAAASSARNFGLRGAAPWVARHAAKHAEELRKRNAEPPPPGSARATLRVPLEAEQIKSRVAELHQAMGKVRSLRKRFEKSFYEIGEILVDVQSKQLHEAKGYSTFEAFLDREVELPRSVSLRLLRIVQTFQRDTAYDFGLERLTSAIAALDGELTAAPPSHPSSRGFSATALPPRPPLRFDD